MGVTPAGVVQTVTLTVLQSWRWSRSHSAVGGAGVVAAQGGELQGAAQDPLLLEGRAPAVPGRSVQGEVEPLRPRGLAPKRLRDRDHRAGWSRQAAAEEEGQWWREAGRSSRVVASGACQGSEWILVVQSWLLAGTQ